MLDKVVGVRISRCDKVLPTVYSDSLSYYEELCKFVEKLNEVIDFANNLTDEVLEEAKAYTDSAIAQTFEEVDRKIAELTQLIQTTEEDMEQLVADTVTQFNQLIDDLQSQYNRFTQIVNANIDRIEREVGDVNDRLDDSIVAINESVDLKILRNNEYLIDEIAGNLPNELKVLNALEGVRMTVQDMFDYLCDLHITDGITVTELASRELTCNRIVAIDRSVRDCVMYGNTIFVQ